MTGNDKFVAILGFAKRAGKVVYGYDDLKNKVGIRLYAVSTSASQNLSEGMTRLAEKNKITLITVTDLELVVGGNCKALGITDASMSKGMLDYAAEHAPQYRVLPVIGGSNCQTTRT